MNEILGIKVTEDQEQEIIKITDKKYTQKQWNNLSVEDKQKEILEVVKNTKNKQIEYIQDQQILLKEVIKT